jgi:hypothetical protein
MTVGVQRAASVQNLLIAGIPPETRIAERAHGDWEVRWRASLVMSPRVPGERSNAIESVGCGIR